MLSKRIAPAAHIYLLGLFHRGGNSFLSWVLQFPGLAQQGLGARAVLPLPAAPPDGWCHRQCLTQVWALLAAKPKWGSKAVSLLHSVCAHLRLPQLPPSSRSTELLMLKNRFFPQIWPWCGGLMENPSSCCCKTPFPWKEGKFYCSAEPAEGMHIQFILVPPGNSVWPWHVRAVTAWGLLSPVREVLQVWAQSRWGGEALCFKHWCSHLLKLSLNLMSAHLLHGLLLSAPAG